MGKGIEASNRVLAHDYPEIIESLRQDRKLDAGEEGEVVGSLSEDPRHLCRPSRGFLVLVHECTICKSELTRLRISRASQSVEASTPS